MQTFRSKVFYSDSMSADAAASPASKITTKSKIGQGEEQRSTGSLLATIFKAVILVTSVNLLATQVNAVAIPKEDRELTSTTQWKQILDNTLDIENNLVETSSENEYKTYKKPISDDITDDKEPSFKEQLKNIYANRDPTEASYVVKNHTTIAPEITTVNKTVSVIKKNTTKVEPKTEKTPSLLEFMGRIFYELNLDGVNSSLPVNSTEDYESSTNITDSDNSEDRIFSDIRRIEGLKTEEEYTEEYLVSSTTEAPNPFGALWEAAETVAGNVMEMLLPKGIRDLMRRMQKQNEELETIRLRSREENGGIGQFGRSIIKGVSSGIVEPLVRGARDIGSLDSDNNFFAGVVNGVTSMASEVMDTFKDRVKAIYPGTLWCGDGHLAAEARALGVFARTDTCCRRHDACSAHIPAGGTRHNLTNTGIFTRSHCGCDGDFRDCLRRLNTPISAQVGFTYFTVLGPQCFRFAHPIVRCVRKTRITGQKCEEYELDYSKPKMWQWFDNETY